ncbi:hypothetical protein [Microcystis aeruginosa]|uniref:hypothetical protein n=1 Tax=Microcystis aeruginosa TaxID=1126 RepID=UPI000ABE5EC3|nr:hypothetical protein [Microcystis aeruginosa]
MRSRESVVRSQDSPSRSSGDRRLFYLFSPHPTPHTRHPTPHTPHPTPYTPHPTPHTPLPHFPISPSPHLPTSQFIIHNS